MNAEKREKVEITGMEYTPTLLDRWGSVKEIAKSKTVGFCGSITVAGRPDFHM